MELHGVARHSRIATLVVLIAIAASVPAAAQPASIVSIVPARSTWTLDDTIELEVAVDDVSNLGAFQFTVAYDASLLQFVNIELGPVLGATGREVVELPVQAPPGEITYAAYTLPGPPAASGGGALAFVTFIARDVGRADVEVVRAVLADADNEPIASESRDGQVRIEPKGFRNHLPLVLKNVAELPSPPPPPTRPPATATPSPTATSPATPTPTTTPTPSGPKPRISELQCYGRDEWVTILNEGGEALDLEDWQVFSTQGIQTYRFRDPYTLEPGKTVEIHSGPGAPDEGGNILKWDDFFIWNEISGDTAQLKDDAIPRQILDSRDCATQTPVP